MGVASKAISFASRFMALTSSVIVAGLLGRFMRHLHQLGFGGGHRVVYALSLAGISTFFALLLLAPLKFSFWAFPLDIAMFIMWIVAFGLLTSVRFPPSAPSCGSTIFKTGKGEEKKQREEIDPWLTSSS
ncbi:hypothetical protein IMZ48_14755 [Candidatus Bathyarchaeota archaeon]|nr:hypothetical protein [Candidatus Bathyarchaeota archaeon]